MESRNDDMAEYRYVGIPAQRCKREQLVVLRVSEARCCEVLDCGARDHLPRTNDHANAQNHVVGGARGGVRVVVKYHTVVLKGTESEPQTEE